MPCFGFHDTRQAFGRSVAAVFSRSSIIDHLARAGDLSRNFRLLILALAEEDLTTGYSPLELGQVPLFIRPTRRACWNFPTLVIGFPSRFSSSIRIVFLVAAIVIAWTGLSLGSLAGSGPVFVILRRPDFASVPLGLMSALC